MSDFPDYEAMDTKLQELVGCEHGYEWGFPYTGGDYYDPHQAILVAALGDKVLYEKCDHSEFTHNGLRRLAFDNGKHHVTFDETPDHSCHECRDDRHTKDDGWYCDGWVQMWPKENDDDS